MISLKKWTLNQFSRWFFDFRFWVELFWFISFEINSLIRTVLFSFHFIVFVNVTVLTQPVCVQFLMFTFPWFFCSSILMVTIVAHSFRIMFSVIMSTVYVLLFTDLNKKIHFLFVGFNLRNWILLLFLWLVLKSFDLLGEELKIKVHVLINELLLMWEELILWCGHSFENGIGLSLGSWKKLRNGLFRLIWYDFG